MIIKKILCVFLYAVSILFLVINTLPLEIPAQQSSKVHNLNKDEDYTTIQQAINAADFGDIIYARNGIYPENVVVNKTVSLIGENKFNTIIDGEGSGNVIFISADNVTVAGFTIQNSGSILAVGGVCMDRSVGNEIIGNILRNNEYGVYLSYSSQNLIVNNTVSNNFYGIGSTSSENNTISQNDFLRNNHGIWLSYSVSNTICGNNVSSNLVEGVLLSACTNNIFSENRVINNINGFHIISSTHNDFFGNNVSMNQQAFFLSASSFNTFSRNNVSLNNYCAVLGASRNNLFSSNYIMNNINSFRIVTSHKNTIFHNNFINTLSSTTQQPYITESENFWDNEIEGNYWSEFNGSDENEDGISDTSYLINEGNEDTYPLMGPLTRFRIAVGTQSYTINVLCNSTISDFKHLRYPATRTNSLSFQVSGKANNIFCRICISHSLIEPPYKVTANNNTSLRSRIVHSNGTDSWLYLTCYCPEFETTIISISSLEQPVWYQLWFWAVVGLILVVLILSVLIIKYRRTLSKQKKLIETYEVELQKKSKKHLETARALFKTDVKTRKSKIKMFEKKYNLKIRPRDNFEKIIRAVKLKRDRKKEDFD